MSVEDNLLDVGDKTSVGSAGIIVAIMAMFGLLALAKIFFGKHTDHPPPSS